MTGDAQELLKLGDLDGALAALQAAVRADPADAKHRIFLFQLLCVTGDWNRAITQLKVSAELEPLALMMAQTYREGIICEVYREKVFAGEKSPMIFGEPEEWIAILIESLKALAAGDPDRAADLRARAFDAAPAMSGELNGETFDWIGDADMRLGPILEMVVNGQYVWMPFTAIRNLTAEPPEDLRDSVWTPVHLTLENGGDMVALIPTRYSGTIEQGDAAAKLSRLTDWVDAGAGTYVGIGQRLLATSAGDVALMDLRTLRMDQPAAEEVATDG